MKTREIQRIQKLDDLSFLREGAWVEVEERGEMRVFKNSPWRRLELIGEISGNGIGHIDISYNQIEPTPEGFLKFDVGSCNYFPENIWYNLLKSKLEAD